MEECGKNVCFKKKKNKKKVNAREKEGGSEKNFIKIQLKLGIFAQRHKSYFLRPCVIFFLLFLNGKFIAPEMCIKAFFFLTPSTFRYFSQMKLMAVKCIVFH
jgi:hypothetical protein